MSPGVVIAIAVGTATALVMALVAARQAGGDAGAVENYGRELDVPVAMQGRRRARPGMRQRAMMAIIFAAIALVGAGMAIGLGNGHH